MPKKTGYKRPPARPRDDVEADCPTPVRHGIYGYRRQDVDCAARLLPARHLDLCQPGPYVPPAPHVPDGWDRSENVLLLPTSEWLGEGFSVTGPARSARPNHRTPKS